MNTDTHLPDFDTIFTTALLSGNEAKIEACEAYMTTGRTYDDHLALIESIRVINTGAIHYDGVIPTMFGTNQEQMKRFETPPNETSEINFQVAQPSFSAMPFTEIACHCDAFTLACEGCRCDDDVPELIPCTEEEKLYFSEIFQEQFKLPFTINPAEYIPNLEPALTKEDLQNISDDKAYFQPDPLKENCFTLIPTQESNFTVIEHSSGDTIDAHNFFKTRLTSGATTVHSYFEDDENRCGGRFIAGTSDTVSSVPITIEEKDEIITTNIGGFLVTDTTSNCEAHARMSGKYQYESDPEVMKRFILLPVAEKKNHNK